MYAYLCSVAVRQLVRIYRILVA